MLKEQIQSIYEQNKKLDQKKALILKPCQREFQLLQEFALKFEKYKKIRRLGRVTFYEKPRELDLNVIKELVMDKDRFEFADYDQFRHKFHRMFKRKLLSKGGRFNEDELQFIWLFIHGTTSRHRENHYCAAYEKILAIKPNWFAIVDRQNYSLNLLRQTLHNDKASVKKQKRSLTKLTCSCHN